MSADHVDTRQVMAEVHAEVRRRRAAGDLPADLEQELDAVFARFAPAGSVEEDFSDLLDKVERAAFVDGNAPVASNLPGGQAVKNAIRRATGFTVQHLTTQISAYDHAVVRALRVLDERLRAVEVAPSGALGWDVAVPPFDPDLTPWFALLTETLAGRSGRVLHAEAREGQAVRHLRDAGLDAYGVEPAPGVAGRAEAGVEVRETGALEHLSMLAERVLDGLVLSGCTDTLSRRDQRALLAQAAVALRPGAPLVVVGTQPEAWTSIASPVVRDLAPGQPLHAETWAHMLAGGPFSAPEVHQADGRPTYAVTCARTS